MVTSKTMRFWGHYVRSDPAHFPGFLARRVREQVTTPPTGAAEISFGDVRLPLDMSVHTLMAKYYFKTHEMFLERVFRSFLQPGQTFIDVGTNYGYWSAFAANQVGPAGSVHMFEPVPRYFASLVRFAELNPGYQLIPNQTAVGAELGVADMDIVTNDPSNFTNYDVNTGSNSLLDGFLAGSPTLTTKERVPVIRLDDYVAESGLDAAAVGLVKVDVEGYESFVLDGMPELLRRRVPLLVEVVTAPDRNPILNGPAVVSRLRRLGYTCLDATTMRPVGRMGLEENVLCVPRR